MTSGQLHQVVHLGFAQKGAIGTAAALDPHRPPGSIEADNLPGEHPALLQRLAHPQAAAQAPPDLAQRLRLLRMGQNGDQGAGPALLHLHGLAEHLHGAGAPQLLDQEGQVLSAGVIELGLLLQKGLTVGRGGIPLARRSAAEVPAGGLGQHQPQQVGAIQCATAEADAHPRGQQGRRRPETLGQHRHQRQPRGGGEFGRGKIAAGGQRHSAAAGQLQHRRRWQGQAAVGGLHAAMAGRRHPTHQLLNAEMAQTGADPHHIHQGIDRPHLMEMHLLRCVAMHAGLRLGQQAEHRQHLLP